jgi:hypothetical protein
MEKYDLRVKGNIVIGAGTLKTAQNTPANE